MIKLNASLRTASAVLFPALAIACGLLWTTAALAQPGVGLGPPPMSVEMLQIKPVERTEVTGDVVHYLYDLKVGPGVFDRIEVHRVVREKQNQRPIKTLDGIFLVGGAQRLTLTLSTFGGSSPRIGRGYLFTAFIASLFNIEPY